MLWGLREGWGVFGKAREVFGKGGWVPGGAFGRGTGADEGAPDEIADEGAPTRSQLVLRRRRYSDTNWLLSGRAGARDRGRGQGTGDRGPGQGARGRGPGTRDQGQVARQGHGAGHRRKGVDAATRAGDGAVTLEQ